MIGKILKNYTSLTIIRVLSRALDYLLMIYLIRQVISAQILGHIVGLELILNISLHITKQCFKPSYLRETTNSSSHKQQNIVSAMNLMTFGIITTILSAIVACCIQWNQSTQLPYMQYAIILYGIAGIFDAIKQKYTVQLNLQYQYTKIALIQLVSYFPKTILFFFAAKTQLFSQYGILLFGVGKLVFYGMCFLITYSLSKHKSLILFRHLKIEKQTTYINPKTKAIVKQLSLITFLKMFLQQFQKIILVVNNSIEISSVYSLISHIGSIIVRYLFAPLQQIAYNFYSRGSQQESVQALLHIVKGLLYFSTMCIAYGFRYSHNVLELVYKQKWVNDQSIRAFDAYLLLLSVMGINGAMQAFVLAKAHAVQTIPKFKYFTIFSSLCYFGSSLLLLHLNYGAASIFLGNSIGMTIRIIISWNIQVKKHINLSSFIKGILPNLPYLLILSLCIYSSHKIKDKFQLNSLHDFLIGAILFGITLIPILIQYWRQVRGIILKVIGRKQEKLLADKNE